MLGLILRSMKLYLTGWFTSIRKPFLCFLPVKSIPLSCCSIPFHLFLVFPLKSTMASVFVSKAKWEPRTSLLVPSSLPCHGCFFGAHVMGGRVAMPCQEAAIARSTTLAVAPGRGIAAEATKPWAGRRPGNGKGAKLPRNVLYVDICMIHAVWVYAGSNLWRNIYMQKMS